MAIAAFQCALAQEHFRAQASGHVAHALHQHVVVQPRGVDVAAHQRIAELGAAEQFILTVTETGFGKRSSAYEYRRTGRGGQGLTAHGLGGRAGKRLAAAFPVEESDDLLLVTSGGQMIRTPVSQVRVVGRSSQGVTIFRTADGEKVVSVERLPDSGGDEAEIAGEEGEA